MATVFDNHVLIPSSPNTGCSGGWRWRPIPSAADDDQVAGPGRDELGLVAAIMEGANASDQVVDVLLQREATSCRQGLSVGGGAEQRRPVPTQHEFRRPVAL